MVFTNFAVKDSVNNITENSSINYLHLIKLNIENEYNSILFQKEYALARYKEQLKNVTNLAIEHIDNYWQLYKKGKYSEKIAKDMAAESLKNFRYGNNDYFFAYTLDLFNISHPDSNIYKHNLSDYQDVKGNYVIREMKKKLTENDSGYLSFWYIRLGETEPVEKLCYLTLYKKWNWMVGTGVYIGDVVKDYDKRMQSVMEELTSTFSKIKIGKTGYFFLFDENKKILIHPAFNVKKLSDFKNPDSGLEHMDELIKASETPDKPYIYYCDKPGFEGKFLVKSYVIKFKPLNWYICSSVYQDELDEPLKNIRNNQMIITFIIVSMSIIISFLLVNRVTKSLKILTNYATKLSSSEFSMLSSIDKEIIGIGKSVKDEVSELSAAFSFMINSLKNHIEKLKETTSLNERIKSELRIASEIQNSMLPNPPEMTTEKFEIMAKIIPAAEVGGDLYDFFYIDDNRICFLIGDISDKGVPAALFMSKTKTALRLITYSVYKLNNEISPSEILKALNAELIQNNEIKMFATMFLAIYDLRTGKLVFSNAGHNLPIIISSQIEFLKKTKGIPLGIKDKSEYSDGIINLIKGDCLLLYTDGITESMNNLEDFFGEKRLLEFFNSLDLKNKSLKFLIEKLLVCVNDFSAGCAQSDDIALLAFRRI